MKQLIVYWIIGCALIGASLPQQQRCTGHLPSSSQIAQTVAIWPVIAFGALFAPKDFKFQECSQAKEP